jgi:DNA repair protein SbcD/Mre11
MKFAHLADTHLGAWREPKLTDLNTKAFEKAIEVCIAKQVDFVLISGDLFNTSLPPIDKLKAAVIKFKELKEANIPTYIIPGSHDFSPSGKTMLDVLEEAGLFINVSKNNEIVDNKIKLNFTIDAKTGAKITGMLGRKGGLETTYYENLIKENIEKEEGFKIFMFHTALAEFKPKNLENMDAAPLSLLPKHFNYYAGGHVHYIFNKEEKDYGLITYPGPIFPNNFKEIEDLERGGFYFYDEGKLEHIPIQTVNTFKIHIKANHLTPEQVNKAIQDKIKDKEFNNTLITIRVEGVLESGKPSDINFKDLFALLYEKSAYFVMKNTAALTSKEFEEIKVDASSREEAEEKLILEHLGQIKVDNLSTEKEKLLTRSFMKTLAEEKNEGETVTVFQKRVLDELKKLVEF